MESPSFIEIELPNGTSLEDLAARAATAPPAERAIFKEAADQVALAALYGQEVKIKRSK